MPPSGADEANDAPASGSVAFRLTSRDLGAASQQAYLSGLLGWGRLLAFVVFLAAPGYLTGMNVLAMLVGLLIMMVLHLFVAIAWIPWTSRRVFAELRALHGEIRAEWDAIGIRFAAPAGETRLGWADYSRWREDAHNILLSQSDALFQVVPKAAWSAADIAGMRRFAAVAGLRGARSS